jgi:hypothetical protein
MATNSTNCVLWRSSTPNNIDSPVETRTKKGKKKKESQSMYRSTPKLSTHPIPVDYKELTHQPMPSKCIKPWICGWI